MICISHYTKSNEDELKKHVKLHFIIRAIQLSIIPQYCAEGATQTQVGTDAKSQYVKCAHA